MKSRGEPGPAQAPLVASIVLNYGRADLCAGALESLARTRCGGREPGPARAVLLVDNGSPDRGAGAQAAARAAGVEALALEENLGFGAGMNRGVEEALRRWSPSYLFLLNNDARVEPEALGRLVRAAGERGADLVGPKILEGDGSEEGGEARLWAAGGTLSPWRFLASNRGQGEVDRGQYEAPEECPFLSACALLVRREAWERLGGFDPRFFLYQEDVDLCLRAGRLGLKLVYEPSARVHHLGSATAGGEYGTLQSFYRWRNRLHLFRKHSRGLHRAFLLSCFFPAVAARDLLRYAGRGRLGQARALFAGLADFLRSAVRAPPR